MDNWVNRHWRPACAIVYLMICLTDFVIMPAWYQYQNTQFSFQDSIIAVKQFDDPAVQISLMQQLMATKTWQPLTLDGTGWVHVSFMAILGVSAWTRGQEKIRRMDGDYPPSRSGQKPHSEPRNTSDFNDLI